jgi:hypothetical protein
MTIHIEVLHLNLTTVLPTISSMPEPVFPKIIQVMWGLNTPGEITRLSSPGSLMAPYGIALILLDCIIPTKTIYKRFRESYVPTLRAGRVSYGAWQNQLPSPQTCARTAMPPHFEHHLQTPCIVHGIFVSPFRS